MKNLLLALLVLVFVTETVAQNVRALAESSGSSHASTEAGASHEAKAEGPSTSSFTGPLVVGALAIVLIGAVVKFRTRQADAN